MRINLYTMLKTLLFTLQNGKSLSSGMQLLSSSAQTKKERAVYTQIYDDLKEGLPFSQALDKHRVGSLDVIQFITMAEKGVSFMAALKKIIHYLEVKEKFERESSDQTSIPVIYFSIATVVVISVKFFAVPYQIGKSREYSKEIIDLVGGHLQIAQSLTDILFIGLILVASYFTILLLSLFNESHFIQGVAKQLALVLPLTSTIVMRFEKFMLFSMMGDMLQSGISLKKVMHSAVKTTMVGRFKKALKESLDSIRYDGRFIYHKALYDQIEQGLLRGAGSSSQVGSVMLEISDRARTDALTLSTKFFRLITLLSILLMAFAVFIEFYTVVLTQILIQKGLIDATRGAGAFG